MFIQNVNKFINKIVHKNKEIKVVDGIVEVPEETAKHFLGFPGWSTVTTPIADKTIKELRKIDVEPKSDTKSKAKK